MPVAVPGQYPAPRAPFWRLERRSYPAHTNRVDQAGSVDWRIGCSGCSDNQWRGDFYPAVLPRGRWLEHDVQCFVTVESNASFYCLPSRTAFAAWRERTPLGFTFAVKASRTITHYRRLRPTAQRSLALLIDKRRQSVPPGDGSGTLTGVGR